MVDEQEYDSAHDDTGTGARARTAHDDTGTGARARTADAKIGGLGASSMKISYRSILQACLANLTNHNLN